jgi:hypothetical protein
MHEENGAKFMVRDKDLREKQRTIVPGQTDGNGGED